MKKNSHVSPHRNVLLPTADRYAVKPGRSQIISKDLKAMLMVALGVAVLFAVTLVTA